jgi:hypothetical protein
MGEVRWSWKYDAWVRKFPAFLLVLFWIGLFAPVTMKLLNYAEENFGADSDAEIFLFAIPLMVWVIVGTFIHIYLISPVLRTLSSYLYIRTQLKTPVSFAEARPLREIFCPAAEETWHPLRRISELPESQRREALFAQARIVLSAIEEARE